MRAVGLRLVAPTRAMASVVAWRQGVQALEELRSERQAWRQGEPALGREQLVSQRQKRELSPQSQAARLVS